MTLFSSKSVSNKSNEQLLMSYTICKIHLVSHNTYIKYHQLRTCVTNVTLFGKTTIRKINLFSHNTYIKYD